MVTLGSSGCSSGRRRTWVLPLLNLSFMVGLLSFHVHADSGNTTTTSQKYDPFVDLWNRVCAGPDALTNLDRILFVSLIMLGMEILTWITKHLGGTSFSVFEKEREK